MTALRIATRPSALARAQTAIAAATLTASGVADVAVVVVESHGDRARDTPVTALEGQGWFTAEVEQALLDGRADVAVHSAKDLPTASPPELDVAALLERGDVRDALVSTSGAFLADLSPGTRLGTSSPRRAALARASNPGIKVVPIRGNVDTRLRKLDDGEFDALILAGAGIDRLGLAARITQRLDPAEFVPAPAQGALALQVASATDTAAIVTVVDDATTRAAVTVERLLLAELGGGCLLPLGAWARVEGGQLILTAALPHSDGDIRRTEVGGPLDAPEALAARAAAALR